MAVAMGAAPAVITAGDTSDDERKGRRASLGGSLFAPTGVPVRVAEHLSIRMVFACNPLMQIGHRDFIDGQRRAVHIDDDGNPYVLDDTGKPVRGVWPTPEVIDADPPNTHLTDLTFPNKS